MLAVWLPHREVGACGPEGRCCDRELGLLLLEALAVVASLACPAPWWLRVHGSLGDAREAAARLLCE
jgi:hypothetical protein